jgi:hypothetical protein
MGLSGMLLCHNLVVKVFAVFYRRLSTYELCKYPLLQFPAVLRRLSDSFTGHYDERYGNPFAGVATRA